MRRNPTGSIIVFLLLFSIHTQSGAGEEKDAHARIAVLDLDAPVNCQWLGAAISASVQSKLACEERLVVIEREKLQQATLACKKPDELMKVTGAQFLLMGNVQLLGEWPDETAKLRISAKIVGSETARLEEELSFVIDGTVGNLFDLETDLARRMAGAVRGETPVTGFEYREARTLTAQKSFGEGLLKLRQSQKLAAWKNEPSADDGKNAIESLNEAITFFRNAQELNAGGFYHQAHTNEGLARELLASLQPDDLNAKQVRDETIKQFRSDAAEAAPALYDLGRALQANDQPDEAIEAYENFLKWIDEREKTVLYRLPRKNLGQIQMNHINAFEVYENNLLTQDKGKIFLSDAITGKALWSKPVYATGSRSREVNLGMGGDVVVCYYTAGVFIIFDRKSGKQINRFPLPAELVADAKKYADNECIRLHVSDDSSTVVITFSSIWIDGKDYPGLLAGINLSDGKLLWKNTAHYMSRKNTSYYNMGEKILFAYGRFVWKKAKYFRLLQFNMKTGESETIYETGKITLHHDMNPWIVKLPDGKYMVGSADGSTRRGVPLVYNPQTNEVVKSTDVPEQLFSISSDFPNQWWVVHYSEKNNVSSQREIYLLDSPKGGKIWTYKAPGRVGQIRTHGKCLLAHVGDEVLCISPPAKAGTPKKRQSKAWMQLGNCFADLRQYDKAVDAFTHAEAIDPGDSELYWQWAKALPDKTVYSKSLFQLYDTFLMLASPEDARRKTAFAEMKKIAGLKFIMDGIPIWDGSFLGRHHPYLVPIRGFRPSAQKHSTLVAYSPEDGRVLWQKPFVEQEMVALQTNLESNFIHKGDRFIFFFPHKNPMTKDSSKRLVLGDANTGKIISAVKSGKGLRSYLPYCCPMNSLLENGFHFASTEGALQLKPADPTVVQFVDFADEGILWESRLLKDKRDHISDAWLLKNKAYFLVFENYSKPNADNHNRAVCLDVKDGHVIWDKNKWPSDISNNRGFNSIVVKESGPIIMSSPSKLFYMDLNTGEITKRVPLLKDALQVEQTDRSPPFERYYGNLVQVSVPRSKNHYCVTDNGELIESGSDEYYKTISAHVKNSKYMVLNGSSYKIQLFNHVDRKTVSEYRFLRPTLEAYISFVWHDDKADNVLAYDMFSRSTYVFDRKKLTEFLLLPRN